MAPSISKIDDNGCVSVAVLNLTRAPVRIPVFRVAITPTDDVKTDTTHTTQADIEKLNETTDPTIEQKRRVVVMQMVEKIRQKGLWSEERLKEIEQQLWEYRCVWSVDKDKPPGAIQLGRIIELQQGAVLPYNPPRRFPPAQQQEIEKQVRKQLEGDIIEKYDAATASPVVLAKKSNGTWRFCVDLREVNKRTIRVVFPLPTVDEVLTFLSGDTIFSKCDANSAFW